MDGRKKVLFRAEQLPLGGYTIVGSKAGRGLCSSPYCDNPLAVIVRRNGKWWGQCTYHLTR